MKELEHLIRFTSNICTMACHLRYLELQWKYFVILRFFRHNRQYCYPSRVYSILDTKLGELLQIHCMRNEDKPGRQRQYYTHRVTGHSFYPQHQKPLLHHSSAKFPIRMLNRIMYLLQFTALDSWKFQIPCKSSLPKSWALHSLLLYNRY